MTQPGDDIPQPPTHEELTVQVAWNRFVIRCIIVAGTLVTALGGAAITLLSLYVTHVKLF